MNLIPLRPAQLVEAQAVAASLFPWESEHQPGLAASVAPEDYEEFLRERGLHRVQAWTLGGGGAVEGLATLYTYSSRPEEVWLAWFGLLPCARGRGAGRAAMSELLDLARSQGAHAMRLWTTDEPEYAVALRLYMQLGFVPETYPALPGEDWTTLVLSLGLQGQRLPAWSSVADRPELCGRVAWWPRAA